MLTRSPGASRFAAARALAGGGCAGRRDGRGSRGAVARAGRGAGSAGMRRLAGELSVPLRVDGRSSCFKPLALLRSAVRAELLARARRESTVLAGAAAEEALRWLKTDEPIGRKQRELQKTRMQASTLAPESVQGPTDLRRNVLVQAYTEMQLQGFPVTWLEEDASADDPEVLELRTFLETLRQGNLSDLHRFLGRSSAQKRCGHASGDLAARDRQPSAVS